MMTLMNSISSKEFLLDEYISQIRLGGKYNFICYAVYDSHSNRVVFEV